MKLYTCNSVHYYPICMTRMQFCILKYCLFCFLVLVFLLRGSAHYYTLRHGQVMQRLLKVIKSIDMNLYKKTIGSGWDGGYIFKMYISNL